MVQGFRNPNAAPRACSRNSSTVDTKSESIWGGGLRAGGGGGGYLTSFMSWPSPSISCTSYGRATFLTPSLNPKLGLRFRV